LVASLAFAVALSATLATLIDSAVALSATLATLVAAALLISSTTMCTSSMLFRNKVVSGVSGKGRRASAGATASGYAANHASIRVGKMRVWRVCTAAYDGLQNLIGGGVNG
jgi:hypothetical protein